MAEVSSTTESSYDYSMIGSVGGEAAQSVNGEMINKIRAAEEKSLIDPISESIDNISLGTEKIEEIKTKIKEFENVVNYFDLYTDENVFNQFLFDTSGTAAVYDATNMSTLKEGTTTINITQLAQKDVYQTEKLTGITEDSDITQGQNIGNNLSIKIGDNDAYEFTMYNLNDAGDAIESAKTYEELVDEINQKDDLQASLEMVGTDDGDPVYRLVIKSAEPGTDNELTITQNGLDFGLGDSKSTEFETEDDYNNFTLTDNSKIVINGEEIIADTGDDMTLSEMINAINLDGRYAAEKDGNSVKIYSSTGAEVTIDDENLNLKFASASHTLAAQNLEATIDGVEYDISSNSITTQGSLKITALELGTSTVTVSKDSSAVKVAADAMVTQYNELQKMLNDEIYSSDSPIEDKDLLKNILSDLKNILFQNYGAKNPEFGDDEDDYGDIVKSHSNVTNNEISIFSLGFELDKSGNLSLDEDEFNDIVNRTTPEYYTNEDGDLVKKMDLDDLKSVFTGAYENKGVGVQIKEYLDALDGYEGTFYNYDLETIEKKEELEEEKKEELERLDAKYGIMAEQFSAYSAIIAQMEASFSGLKMMIEQSVASN